MTMEPIYQQEFHINDAAVDCFGRLKPSMLLFYVQEVAGIHATTLGAGVGTIVDGREHNLITATRVDSVHIVDECLH